MSADQEDPRLDRLREAFRSLASDARPTEDCPAPETLWEGLDETLPVDQLRDVVDHTASCAACAEAWRLAVELRAGEASAAERPRAASRVLPFRGRRLLVPLAAAATLVLAVGLGVLWQGGFGERPGYREPGRQEIRSLVPEGEPLDRQACRLRWTGAPEGSRYEVSVTSEGLAVIATARELATPSYLVPASALEALPAGAQLFWQVGARLDDGTWIDSRTFVVTLK